MSFLSPGSIAGTSTGGGGDASAANQLLIIDALATLQTELDAKTEPANTQTISGTVTANAGTNLNTSALALETGGNLAAVATSLGVLDNMMAGNEAQVDVVTSALPTGASTLAEQQTQTTALQLIDNIVLAEDAAHVSGDVGVQLLTVRTNTAASRSGSDGDYQPLITDTNGRLHVTSSSNETTTKEVVGDVAQDAAIAGNPVSVGLRASTAIPSAMSADGDAVYGWADRNGAQVVAGRIVDDAAFTPATDRIHPAGFLFDDVSPDVVDEGDGGIARMSSNRNQYVQLRDGAGNERGAAVNASNQLTVSVDNNPVLGAGTNTIGKLSANSGVDIGDVDVTSLAHGKTLKTASGTCNTSGDNTLVSAVVGKKIKVFAFSLTMNSTSAVTCILQSGAGGTEVWRAIFQAPTGSISGSNLSVSPPAHLFETGSNTLLNLNLSAAVAVHYSIAYFEEA